MNFFVTAATAVPDVIPHSWSPKSTEKVANLTRLIFQKFVSCNSSLHHITQYLLASESAPAPMYVLHC